MVFLSRFKICAIYAWAAMVCFTTACDDRKLETPGPTSDAQFAYFPLQIGKHRIYQIDSIVYDYEPGGGVTLDSSRIFVKELTADSLRDNQGNLVYTIERYERASENEPWAYKYTGTASRNKSQATQTEENLRFLKLVFPMNLRSKWDGNIWIDENREIEIAGEQIRPFTNWAYEVDSIDVQAIVGQFVLDSTLLVTEADDSNVIERRLSKVRYAKHIGLAWREQWILDSQYCNQVPTPADCETRPWEIKAEKGFILRQTLISYN
jgi:hypothetical protein